MSFGPETPMDRITRGIGPCKHPRSERTTRGAVQRCEQCQSERTMRRNFTWGPWKAAECQREGGSA